MDANTGVDNVILVPSAVQVIATRRGQNYEDAVNELSDTATMIASFILKELNIGPPGSSGIIVEV